MALASLLLQHPTVLQETIVLDEPELGLHPAAIAELAGMIRTALKNARIDVATQSNLQLHEFETLILADPKQLELENGNQSEKRYPVNL
jgi:predicted ATPase